MIWWLYLLLVPLFLYAIWLGISLLRQRQKLQQGLRHGEQQQAQHAVDLRTSIDIIAQEFLHNDLNVSETCIRLKVLIDNLQLPAEQRAQFSLLDEFYSPLSQLATHQQRLDLPKSERQKQDELRAQLEQQYLHPMRELVAKLPQLLA